MGSGRGCLQLQLQGHLLVYGLSFSDGSVNSVGTRNE